MKFRLESCLTYNPKKTNNSNQKVKSDTVCFDEVAPKKIDFAIADAMIDHYRRVGVAYD